MSLQAFDAKGESLFDDVEEQCRLISSFGELDRMEKHADSLSAMLRALADAVKTKSISVGDSLSATFEV
jgi:putative NADH-flavin reductase